MDITGSSGLILQQVANIHFYSTKWHFLSYINVTLIEEDHLLLRNLIQELSYLCKDSRRILRKKVMEFDNICDPIRNKLVLYMQDFDRLNYLFYSIPRSLDKLAFPEDSSYEHVHNHISQIKNTTTKFIDDAQNKTTYFQNWYNMQNMANENFNGHLELLQDELVSLQIEVTALNSSERVNFILNPILNRFQKTLTFILALIEKHYFSLTILQKYFASGINYIDLEYFVPIMQLKNLLLHIDSKLLHTGTKLIIDPNSFLARKYYKILHVDTIFSKNLILFQITVPLVQKESYVYYKAVPLPIRLTYNLFAFVVPQYSYFALSIKENIMMPLTIHEFNECTEFKSKYYCQETSVMYSTSERNICEVEAIKTSEVPVFCNYRLVQSNYDLFFPLHRPNTWSFTLAQGASVIAQCSLYSTFSFSIPKQGVMDIPSDCNLQINGLYINVQAFNYENKLQFVVPEHFDYEIKIKMLNIDHLRMDNIPFFDVPMHQRDNMKMLIAGSMGLHDVITEKVMISYKYSFFELFVITFSFIIACLLSPVMIYKCLKCLAINGTVGELINDSYRNLRPDSLILDTQV